MLRCRFLLRSLSFGIGLLAVLLSGTVQAQDKNRFIPGIGDSISREKVVPVSIVQQTPSKARNLLWGTFQRKRTAAEPILGLHLYIRHSFRAGDFANHVYVLDIYSRKGRAADFHRANRIVFHCPDVRSPPTYIQAKWTWLNVSAHQGLVLALHLDPNGVEGNDVFVGLPDNLSARSTPVAILCGSWMASDICGIRSDFIPGAHGRTEVRVMLAPSGDPGPVISQRDYRFTLQWNAQRHRFWPTSKARRVLKDYAFLQPEIIP